MWARMSPVGTEILADFGDSTGGARSLQGFPQADADKWWLQETWDENEWWTPSERFVMNLAGRWSISPSELGPETSVRGKCLLATVLD